MPTRLSKTMPTALLLSLALACLPSQSPELQAPDLIGAEWINTDRPLTSFEKDLRGQVVLLDFWTYCCINCIHVIPDLEKLEEEFKDEPFLVIGVHSNKFPQEGERENIRQAMLRYKIQHPVVVDSDHTIWRSYGVRAWPTMTLIGSDGVIAGQAAGEGHYETLRVAIRSLLDEGKENGTLAEGPLSLEKEVATKTELFYPAKVLAAGEKLYVADSAHDRLLELSSASGEILREFRASNPPLHHPHGMALDGDTLYIADTDNHLLRKLDLETGTFTTLAGKTNLQARPLPDAGPGLDTRLNSPWALDLDGEQLHIAMAGSHQLWTYNLNSGRISLLAGSGYENIVDGPAAFARLAQPSGFARIGRKLYFADSEVSAVRSVDLEKDVVETQVGTGLFRFGDRDGEGVNEVLLQHPLALAVWNGQLLIADTYNNKIKALDPKTARVRTILGTGEEHMRSDALTMWEPGGLDVEGDTLYIADTNHHRILKVDLITKEWKVLIGLSAEAKEVPAKPMSRATRAAADG
ncbi:MAG: redoxin domain-containing protein [Planctomycetes bacterium]|nr:redoxin domain-containing protein [Planctomycetota bacterium]